MRDLLFAIRREGIYQAVVKLVGPEVMPVGRAQLDTETLLSCLDGAMDGMQIQLDEGALDASERAVYEKAIALALNIRLQLAGEQTFLQ